MLQLHLEDMKYTSKVVSLIGQNLSGINNIKYWNATQLSYYHIHASINFKNKSHDVYVYLLNSCNFVERHQCRCSSCSWTLTSLTSLRDVRLGSFPIQTLGAGFVGSWVGEENKLKFNTTTLWQPPALYHNNLTLITTSSIHSKCTHTGIL